MSVDLAWDDITSGADGAALAKTIRDFIHTKFQQITLPRFISAVHVHTFKFGSVSPVIEIKDICDPLPDFYDDDEEDDQPGTSDDAHSHTIAHTEPASSALQGRAGVGELYADELHKRVAALHQTDSEMSRNTTSLNSYGPMHSHLNTGPQTTSELGVNPFPRSGTPGIPGGTSNMSYFHFPMGGLSGAQTPLAAVAGGGPFATQAWLRDQQSHHHELARHHAMPFDVNAQSEESSVRPRTAGSISSPELGSPMLPSSPAKRPVGYFSAEKVSDNVSNSDPLAAPKPPPSEKVSPSDLQVVARVTYTGDVRMMLTAEIMLDYPMPSFIKIPLKLSITGVTFDGVAILAYIKKKMHFCFLDPEDADTLVGSSFSAEDFAQPSSAKKRPTIGSLLREMQVETEIGRQESGKQVLKNVGKVERFVLEQVRRIFEEEFVFPSFWTFLV